MNEIKKTYFLGANTPKGFVSFFSELYNPSENRRVFILKGGPGTGKSGVMRKVAAAVEEAGYEAEYIICSSDPDSLDGVIFPELRACVADGTPPHVIEPKYPGAVEEIVNLGQFWNSEKLAETADSIRAADRQVKNCHQRCVGFLSAAASLQKDSLRIVSECTDFDKIAVYASRFASREFGISRGRIGKEKKRLLSAVTPKGIFTNYDTIKSQCSRVIAVYDEYGASSCQLLKLLRGYALGIGLDTTVCCCPLNTDKIEHLIIPEKELCIFTSNSYHPAPADVDRKIHCRRFIDSEKLRTHRHRLHFNSRAAAELIDEAGVMLKSAKENHDDLEQLYIPAMDFDKVNAETEKITKQILNRAKNK